MAWMEIKQILIIMQNDLHQNSFLGTDNRKYLLMVIALQMDKQSVGD